MSRKMKSSNLMANAILHPAQMDIIPKILTRLKLAVLDVSPAAKPAPVLHPLIAPSATPRSSSKLTSVYPAPRILSIKLPTASTLHQVFYFLPQFKKIDFVLY